MGKAKYFSVELVNIVAVGEESDGLENVLRKYPIVMRKWIGTLKHLRPY
jgi:type II secretory pathway component PulF